MFKVTQGDTVTLTLYAKDVDGNLVDLTGASFSSELKGSNGAYLTFDNTKHTADADQVANRGKYTLVLDSTNVPIGEAHEIVTAVTISAATVHYHQPAILTVMSPHPAS